MTEGAELANGGGGVVKEGVELEDKRWRGSEREWNWYKKVGR